jgi:hypothetical protein
VVVALAVAESFLHDGNVGAPGEKPECVRGAQVAKVTV